MKLDEYATLVRIAEELDDLERIRVDFPPGPENLVVRMTDDDAASMATMLRVIAELRKSATQTEEMVIAAPNRVEFEHRVNAKLSSGEGWTVKTIVAREGDTELVAVLRKESDEHKHSA